MQKWLRNRKLKIEIYILTRVNVFDSLFLILSLNIDLFTHKSYKMVDSKTKRSIIRHIQNIYIQIMKINNIILMLFTCFILLSQFVIYFFCIISFGKLSIIYVGRVQL